MSDWETRFWAKVQKTKACWLWTPPLRDDGYGQFRLNGRTRAPHQVSFELVNGPIPEGMFVDHACLTRHCVNPTHLRACTIKESNENLKGAQANSKSGVRGVVWHKQRRKWYARVTHNYKVYIAGYFDDLEDAEQAVVAKRLELFTHNTVDRQKVSK